MGLILVIMILFSILGGMYYLGNMPCDDDDEDANIFY